MKKISNERKKELLKQVTWDYNIPGDILLNILEKRLDAYAHLNRKSLLNRYFNYLNWYQFVSLFNENELLEAVMIRHSRHKYK